MCDDEEKGRVEGDKAAPYLVRPDGAGGHLFNGQGLLQLCANRGAVVPAAALSGSPATQNKAGSVGQPCREHPRAALRGSGRSRGCTCRPTTEGGTACRTRPPRPGQARGGGGVAGARQEEPDSAAQPRESGRAAQEAFWRQAPAATTQPWRGGSGPVRPSSPAA